MGLFTNFLTPGDIVLNINMKNPVIKLLIKYFHFTFFGKCYSCISFWLYHLEGRKSKLKLFWRLFMTVKIITNYCEKKKSITHYKKCAPELIMKNNEQKWAKMQEDWQKSYENCTINDEFIS